jgi:hypothetical protein
VFNIKSIASGSSCLLMAVFSGMSNSYSSDVSTGERLYIARLYTGSSICPFPCQEAASD